MRILHVIPYPLYPPQNGGQLRCFHLLQELAREHEVHALLFQRRDELRSPAAGYAFPENVQVHNPPPTPPRTVFDWLPRRLGPGLHYRWLRRSWRGPASGVVLAMQPLLLPLLTGQAFDLVLFESLDAMMAAPLVRRWGPQARLVLDAHNIDHKLIPAAEVKAYRATRLAETHLAGAVDAFLACSETDRRELETLNRHEIAGYTIPNGVDTSQRPFDDNPLKAQSTTILFCGTLNYEPNRDGLLWLHANIWPLIRAQVPAARLMVVGRNGDLADYDTMKADGSVDFIGEVESVLPYSQTAGIAIVPLRHGSGTRLKILEAMSLGNPVVSTRIGAEGIEAVDGREILLADSPEAIAAGVVRLLRQPELFESQRRAARQLVEEKYDWRVIGRQLRRGLEEIIGKRNA